MKSATRKRKKVKPPQPSAAKQTAIIKAVSAYWFSERSCDTAAFIRKLENCGYCIRPLPTRKAQKKGRGK